MIVYAIGLKVVGTEELARRAEINEKGRGAEDVPSLKKFISVWGDLMMDYEETHGAKATAAAKKNSRYALPDSVRALGIELQKSDTAFLPRHSVKEDKIAGQEEREAAIGRIREAKKRVSADTTTEEEDDDSAGGSASVDKRGKKPNLRPKSLKQEDHNQRGKFLDTLTNYLTSEAMTGAAERMEKKSLELDRYTNALTAHPELSHIYIPLMQRASEMLKIMHDEELRQAQEHNESMQTSSQPSTAQKATPGSGACGGSDNGGG